MLTTEDLEKAGYKRYERGYSKYATCLYQKQTDSGFVINVDVFDLPEPAGRRFSPCVQFKGSDDITFNVEMIADPQKLSIEMIENFFKIKFSDTQKEPVSYLDKYFVYDENYEIWKAKDREATITKAVCREGYLVFYGQYFNMHFNVLENAAKYYVKNLSPFGEEN